MISNQDQCHDEEIIRNASFSDEGMSVTTHKYYYKVYRVLTMNSSYQMSFISYNLQLIALALILMEQL